MRLCEPRIWPAWRGRRSGRSATTTSSDCWAVPDEGTTWRSYGFAHLTRLMRIRWLVESGVPLAEVPHMLRPPGTADERRVVIEDLDAVLCSIDAQSSPH